MEDLMIILMIAQTIIEMTTMVITIIYYRGKR